MNQDQLELLKKLRSARLVERVKEVIVHIESHLKSQQNQIEDAKMKKYILFELITLCDLYFRSFEEIPGMYLITSKERHELEILADKFRDLKKEFSYQYF